MSTEATNLDQLVTSYAEWLEVKAPDHHKAFLQRLKDEPEAAQTEAVSFGILKLARCNPRPGEVIGTGGVDFVCQTARGVEFAVEVTALLSKNVAKASGLTATTGTGMKGFSQITRGLLIEAVNKATQVANYPMARVLVLATRHPDAPLVMGTHAAEELMTGTSAIRVRIGGFEADAQMLATLKNSVFFRLTKDQTDIEPARCSISAILLMTISDDAGCIIGLLHPAPAVPFDYGILPDVHFLRVNGWPFTENRFRLEWIGPAPGPTCYTHLPLSLADIDLRTS